MTSKDKRNFITATPDSFSETYSMTPARIQMAQNVLKVGATVKFIYYVYICIYVYILLDTNRLIKEFFYTFH